MTIHHEILAEVARHHLADQLAIAEDSRRSAYARLIRRLRRRQARSRLAGRAKPALTPVNRPAPLNESPTTAGITTAETA